MISNAFVMIKINKDDSKKKTFMIKFKLKRKSKLSKPLRVSNKVDQNNTKVNKALMKKKDSEKANDKITSEEKIEYRMIKTLRMNSKCQSKKVTKLLILISFKYVLLNLPYLISWSIFYYKVAFNDAYFATTNYLFAGKSIRLD